MCKNSEEVLENLDEVIKIKDAMGEKLISEETEEEKAE